MRIQTFDPLDELAISLGYPLLRPPGYGLYSESTGANPFATTLHSVLYGSTSREEVFDLWRSAVGSADTSGVLLFGIPSDAGSGSVRGAAYGPIGVREALYNNATLNRRTFVDIGDVLCVPHLLSDELLNEDQILLTRNAIYGDHVAELPVSPLSIAEAVVRGLLNRKAKPPVLLCIGGDHSVTGAVLPPFFEKYGSELGIVHIDAHSDMADTRFGISLTYSSWIKHVDRISPMPAIAQIGLQTDGRPEEVGRRAYRVTKRGCDDLSYVDRLLTWFADKGIRYLYITFDIDAIDASYAPATGLPAENGLSPSSVMYLIDALRAELEIVGADVVEVAPPLGAVPWASESTSEVAAEYLMKLLSV